MAMKENVRVCAINFDQKKFHSFDEFKQKIEYFLQAAADYQCDFILFPEFVTMPLLSIDGQRLSPTNTLARLSDYTQAYLDMMKEGAKKFHLNIIAGTHLMPNAQGKMQNIAFTFLRDGSVHQQAKIHPTPSEVEVWGVVGGDTLPVIQTDCGVIGVQVCYDSEFPELTRHQIDQGAKIIFVPYSTDTRHGHLRVRHCCQARTIENQCYFVLSGNIGNLPQVHNMDINYAQSCVLTPCDFPFARDGVAADTEANIEMLAIADLSLTALDRARESGTVRNLKDRRLDLYSVNWKAP
jgi:predicted amidohydrolase